VVAVASARSRSRVAQRRTDWAWTLAAAGVIGLGLIVRFAIGGGGVGQRSAVVMTVLLAAAAWLAGRLLAGPRIALAVCIVLVALLDLGALPARDAAEYDDLQAFYRTDQVLSSTLAVPSASASASGSVSDLAITVLAQPVISGAQAQFGIAGDVNGTPVAWTCPFQHGIQRLALPLPVTVAALSQGTANVRLHLNGSPSRDGDYLVVYASSRLGGFDLALQPQSAVDRSVVRCTAA
jgi:hypothetical protein